MHQGFSNQLFKAPKCDFKLDRHSTIYIGMFFTDIALFYLIPLVLSVALYGLIAKMLLYTAPRTLTSQDNTRSNQARLQVVKMLIAVVTIFATLWLPWRGLMVYNTVAALYSREDIFMDLWYLMFAKTCIYINRWPTNTALTVNYRRFQRNKPDPLQCPLDQVPSRLPVDALLWLPGAAPGRHLPLHDGPAPCSAGAQHAQVAPSHAHYASKMKCGSGTFLYFLEEASASLALLRLG